MFNGKDSPVPKSYPILYSGVKRVSKQFYIAQVLYVGESCNQYYSRGLATAAFAVFTGTA